MTAPPEVLGTPEDRLRVAALLRCKRKRTLLGAVLYLDRSGRGREPLWLAEVGLLAADSASLRSTVSDLTREGVTTTGARLADCDAVVLPSDPTTATRRRLPVACINYGHGEHEVTAAELIEAGRDGLRRRGQSDTARHVLQLDGVHR